MDLHRLVCVAERVLVRACSGFVGPFSLLFGASLERLSVEARRTEILFRYLSHLACGGRRFFVRFVVGSWIAQRGQTWCGSGTSRRSHDAALVILAAALRDSSHTDDLGSE